MKNTFLVGLALTAAISVNSFAMDIQNGKLINHREWKTGNIKFASFKQTIKKSPFDFKRLQSEDNRSSFAAMKNDAISVLTSPCDGSTYIYSQNEVWLYNYSQSTQTFDVTITMCAFSLSAENHNYNCYDTKDTISLEKNGSIAYGIEPSINVMLKPGQYTSVVSIKTANINDATTYATWAEKEFNVDEQEAKS